MMPRSVAFRATTHANDFLPLSKRDILRFEGCSQVWRQALDQAGVTLDDLSFVETHDCFTIAELLEYEAMGLTLEGQGARAIKEGWTRKDGKLPVNPSGGLKSKGHPIGATGVSMHVLAAMQLCGDAGDMQIPNATPRRGLQHGWRSYRQLRLDPGASEMTRTGPDPKGGVAPVSKRVMNLSHFVWQAARRYGQEIGLVWGDATWTWAEIDRRVDAMVAPLLRHVAVLNLRLIGPSITALIVCSFDPDGPLVRDEFTRLVSPRSEVTNIWVLTGEVDVGLTIVTRTLEECTQIIRSLQENFPQLKNLKEYIVTAQPKRSLVVPFSLAGLALDIPR